MDKMTKAVARLLELTQRGAIQWRTAPLPDLRGTGDFIEIAFAAEYEGEHLRIFRKRSKVALDEERFEWIERPKLEIIDSNGRSLYEFPSHPILYDLLDAVEYQVSGVGPFIEKLASEG